MADSDLSEEAVLQLLRDAEQRLSVANTDLASDNSLLRQDTRFVFILRYTFVLLLTSGSISTSKDLPALYVKTTNNGAKVDPNRLISDVDRKLASKPRCVEDPVAAKAAAANVSILPISSTLIAFYEENLSQRYLDAELGPRLGRLLCIYESRTLCTFIVTLINASKRVIIIYRSLLKFV